MHHEFPNFHHNEMISMHETTVLLCFLFCNSGHVIATGSNVAYQFLASPTKVKQNLWTFKASGKSCVVIQSLVLNKCASTSSSGLPENSGLNVTNSYATVAVQLAVLGVVVPLYMLDLLLLPLYFRYSQYR